MQAQGKKPRRLLPRAVPLSDTRHKVITEPSQLAYVVRPQDESEH